MRFLLLALATALVSPGALADSFHPLDVQACQEFGLHEVCVWRESGRLCVSWWSGMPPTVVQCVKTLA